MSNRKKLIIGGVLVAVVTFVVTTGRYLYLLQRWSGDAVGIIRLVGVINFVKDHYVEDVSMESLYNGAVKGAVSALGDPHSIFMDSKMYKEFMIETEGSFGGVGIVLGVKDKMLTVVSPIEGTPGEQGGAGAVHPRLR